MADGAAGNPRAGEPSAGGSAGAEQEQAGSERVEQRFEQWGRRVGRLLAGAAARAREEAEDIVAEAQGIRRGERD